MGGTLITLYLCPGREEQLSLTQLRGTRMFQPDNFSYVQRKDPDQVQLWGLQEGTYLFQLTVPDSEQQDTSNITITVLSAKQTEGEGGYGGAMGDAQSCDLSKRHLTSFPFPRILPCVQQGGPLPRLLPPLVL